MNIYKWQIIFSASHLIIKTGTRLWPLSIEYRKNFYKLNGGMI